MPAAGSSTIAQSQRLVVFFIEPVPDFPGYRSRCPCSAGEFTDLPDSDQAVRQKQFVRFQRLSQSCWAFTAEGDPNTGVVVGDDGVMVIDAQATPLMAREVIRRIRSVTSKPIRYVVLSHYHAVRVLGASAYRAEHVIAATGTSRFGSSTSRSPILKKPPA